LRRANTGDKGIPGGPESGYKHSKLGVNIPSNMSRAGASDGSRTPTTTKPKVRRRTKEEAKVTEESAETILNYLKLHCMRTRNHDDAVDFLYGRNQGICSPFLEPWLRFERQW